MSVLLEQTLAAWRVAFLLLQAMTAGAVVLLLVARLTGAEWDAALRPLAVRTGWLVAAFVPLVVQQALFGAPPPHLALWMSWPAFAVRGVVGIALWWGLARARPGEMGAALGLVAHGVAVTILGSDWLLGLSPGQPQSAIGMTLATMQLLGATGAACLFRLGSPRTVRDLSFLLLAACLGLAYLLFVDFLIVWYGDLPARVGWYVARGSGPRAVLPPLALAIGLAVPIAAVVGGFRRVAGGGALLGLLLALAWQTGVAA